VAAGFIFVGFGGSRWTAPYVERYIGLGVSTGVKIMLLYLLIGTGMNLSVDWMTEAQKVAQSQTPAMSALEIMGASVIFMMLCWQIPKLFAAVLGGSPALTGGDLISNSAFLAGGAVAVGSLGVGAAAGAAGLLGAGAAGGGVATGGGASATGTAAGAGSASPAMLASAGSNASGSTAPPPPRPSAPESSGPQQPLAPLRSAARNITDMRRGPASPDTA
jgi:type IV secretion system protein TrbL